MKFLIFSPYYPPHIGGLENHAQEFNIHMRKNGHTIIVYTPHIPFRSQLSETDEYGVTIICFPAFELIPGYPVPRFWQPMFWHQWNQLQQVQYDFVISRTRFFFTSIMALWYSKVRHIKYIHIEHGSDFVQLDSLLFSGIAKLYDYTLGKLVFVSANKVVTNSKASAAFVEKITNNKVIPLVIYRGVEPIKVSEHKKNHDPINIPIILYVGRLMDGKGVQDLIHALKKVENKQWLTWIVGDGPCQEKLQVMTRTAGLENRVTFWGEKSHADALEYIHAATIVVNPSYTEGLPTTVIEAARAGKAIIATNVGGTPELIKHKVTGLLYSPKDIDTLIQHIVFFLEFPDMRNTYGIKARESMQGRFSWESAMVQYEHVWHNR